MRSVFIRHCPTMTVDKWQCTCLVWGVGIGSGIPRSSHGFSGTLFPFVFIFLWHLVKYRPGEKQKPLTNQGFSW
jgi:hypothetical protein